MTDSFGFQEALDQEVNLESNPTARVEELKARVREENVNDPEDIMLLIMEIFTIEVLYPEPGKMVIFESRLRHAIPPNSGSGRSIIAGNFISSQPAGTR